MKHPEILAHRLRAIIGKLLNHSDGRIELIEEGGQQFVRFDNQIVGRSIQAFAGVDDLFKGFGLGEFAELVVSLEAGIKARGLCKEEMIALAEFVLEDKRAKWLSIW